MKKEEIQNKVLKVFSKSYYGDPRQEYALSGVVQNLQKAGLFPTNARLRKYDFEKNKWKNLNK
ncbi:hypothetical protein U2088_15560 [Listeria monocytogenes]|uniref:hypothetical protein n=1 Tax=Listeria monocytogenes TaxID=1639 RepID=UPI002FDBF147